MLDIQEGRSPDKYGWITKVKWNYDPHKVISINKTIAKY